MGSTEDVLVLQDLLSSYIDENQLNKLISNSYNQPLSRIKQLLKLKFDFIAKKTQRPIHFPINFLLASEDFLNSNHYSEILQYALLIQKDNTELLLFENFIHTKINSFSTTPNQIINICKLLNVAFDLIENNQFKINIDQSENPRKFYKAVCDMDSKELASHVSVITKKYASKVSTHTILLCLDTILSSGNREVLCCVIEYFLECCNSESEICSLLIKYDIFPIISVLISSYKTVHQRQGVFLLHQIKDYIINNRFFATSASHYIALYDCSIDDAETAWNTFFILSSICREKQIHLVKPALTFLDDIFNLHPLWVKTIYHILFSHSQNEIVSDAVLKMLTSKWFKKMDNFLLLHRNLLETLTKIDYSDATIDGFAALGQYVKNCTEQQFWIVLKESTDFSWNPINMWLFCKNIFKRDCLRLMKISIISKYILHLQKLPNKFIRSGCIKLCLKFVDIQSDFITSLSFEELFKLAAVIKKTDVSIEYFCNILQCPIFRTKSKIENKIRNLDSDYSLFEFRIVLHFIKSFDHPEEFFPQVNDQIFPNPHLVILLNNFETLIEHTNSDIIFAILEDALVCCHKDAVDDVKGLIQKLSSRTDYCELHREKISNLCSKAKPIIIHHSPEYNKEFDIALEILRHFDGESVNSFRDPYEFITLDQFTTGALQLVYKNASRNSVFKLAVIIDTIYDIAEDKVVMATIENLPILFNKTKDKGAICKILQASMKYILKLDRGEQFKHTLKVFLKTFVLAPPLQKLVPYKCSEIIQSIRELSDQCSFVCHLLSAHVHDLVECCPETAVNYKFILIECLLSDACIRKEELSEYNVCKDIFETVGTHDDSDEYVSDQILSRCLAFESMLQLINSEQLTLDVRTKFADDLACILIEKYSLHFNKRYFKDSMVHIQKLRTMQALLLLQPFLSTSKEKIKNLLLECIYNENHQHCVKQLIEWLLIRLLDENEEVLSIFTSLLEDQDMSNKKISTITTSIIILYHTALISPKEDRLLNIIDLLLPWTMGANFKLRVYAQVAILKLFEKAHDYNFTTITTKHKTTHQCIESIFLKASNAFRTALHTDVAMFFFFNPIEDYSLETILTHIPKINNVTCTEWEGCINVFKSKAFNSIKVMNPSKEFGKYFKEAKKASDSKVEESNVPDKLDTIQRKITPWTEITQDKEQVKQLTNLIVVAVFVDKAANIGGLSRTCEIFGVQQLVVHDAKIANDKEYKSLSMCSEGWLNITEVQQKDVKDYLIKMKMEGYNIVAVEQTSDSVNLHEHSFQDKTVLVLGNEKEGIPANVLPLADICVEIPQVGVTRSLNVHVAGSLFIWEYSKSVLFTLK